ncbi:MULTISPECIES: hypothetical protein [unclassified Empedobacter]|uniref:hypothetical protein n=1 Tax=unclassified Empedobacter TaxID=2643773 RepID=UPI0025C4FC24|nr:MULTISPECIES: hypothetical protein [unclassified Empedobacter]
MIKRTVNIFLITIDRRNELKEIIENYCNKKLFNFLNDFKNKEKINISDEKFYENSILFLGFDEVTFDILKELKFNNTKNEVKFNSYENLVNILNKLKYTRKVEDKDKLPNLNHFSLLGTDENYIYNSVKVNRIERNFLSKLKYFSPSENLERLIGEFKKNNEYTFYENYNGVTNPTKTDESLLKFEYKSGLSTSYFFFTNRMVVDFNKKLNEYERISHGQSGYSVYPCKSFNQNKTFKDLFLEIYKTELDDLMKIIYYEFLLKEINNKRINLIENQKNKLNNENNKIIKSNFNAKLWGVFGRLIKIHVFDNKIVNKTLAESINYISGVSINQLEKKHLTGTNFKDDITIEDKKIIIEVLNSMIKNLK